MTAHDLYTRTLSDYKSCLCSSPALTLRSYCRERHVNYHGMCLWLSRHGISIRELRPSLFPSPPLKNLASSFSRLLPVCSSPSSSPDMLYGVTHHFPWRSDCFYQARQFFTSAVLSTVITVKFRRKSHVCFNRWHALLSVPALVLIVRKGMTNFTGLSSPVCPFLLFRVMYLCFSPANVTWLKFCGGIRTVFILYQKRSKEGTFWGSPF